jgi:hypothetical protein
MVVDEPEQWSLEGVDAGCHKEKGTFSTLFKVGSRTVYRAT